MNESCFWNYKRKYQEVKFKQGKKIKFILGFIENESSDMIYYKISNNASELEIKNKKELDNLTKCSMYNFKVLMNGSILNYISILPNHKVSVDFGRKFNKENGLISPKQQ